MAVDISGQAPGGERTRLADALPLAAPFLIQVFPVYACNLRCGYCIFAVDKAEHGFISDATLLDFDLYRKCVDDMAEFPVKPKVVRFVGIGEPLLHKKIADMVRLTVDRDVAGLVEIVTNGTLLTPKMSDALIDAGLGRLVVSTQGTKAEKYLGASKTPIDFNQYVSNLGYFWSHKKTTQMYIKVVDTALSGPEDRKRFFDIFGGICDTIAVENTVPIHHSVDYSDILGEKNNQQTQYGLPIGEVNVCPQPFFHMQINPDGNIVPCYSWDYPGVMGNCRDRSLKEIWNGDAFQAFRRAHLNGRATVSPVCAECTIIKFRLFPQDDLTADAERLKPLYD